MQEELQTEDGSHFMPDLAIVGAGIAGGALAVAAARAGLSVLLLERTSRHEDRVRGEYVPPWGVEEARRLGILDVLLAAGGHFVKRSVGYGEDIEPSMAQARAIALDKLLPGIDGSLTFGHPQVCTALDEAALIAGAVLLRGVTDVEVSPGVLPSVAFSHAGRRRSVRARLVVGADGRGSRIARSIGVQVQSDGSHHLLCGLLTEGAHEWPAEQMTVGTQGEIAFYVFPQGSGRIRLYACYPYEQRQRFSGAGNADRLLAAFQLSSVPHSGSLAKARAIGPCHGYPSGDTWIDRPGVAGVVLIGDAAGHNCPSIGQGLSIAFRDARHIVEAMVADGVWTDSAFQAYCDERKERMRRLRFVAQLFSTLRVEFSPQARERRVRAMQRVAADPTVAKPLATTLMGPFAMEADTFSQAAWDRLLA